MQGPAFQLVTRSRAVDDDDLRRVAVALAIAGTELALAWGLAPPSVEVVDVVSSAAIGITLVESLDVADAVGYHSVGSLGAPYGFVLADPTGSVVAWQRAASHELFEALVDPRCNEWAQDATGRLWALEVCDPVQDDWYGIDLSDGGGEIAISNWCTPAWFADPGPARMVDRMGLLDVPWSLRPGGYAVSITGGRVETVPGPRVRPAATRWTRRLAAASTKVEGGA